MFSDIFYKLRNYLYAGTLRMFYNALVLSIPCFSYGIELLLLHYTHWLLN